MYTVNHAFLCLFQPFLRRSFILISLMSGPLKIWFCQFAHCASLFLLRSAIAPKIKVRSRAKSDWAISKSDVPSSDIQYICIQESVPISCFSTAHVSSFLNLITYNPWQAKKHLQIWFCVTICRQCFYYCDVYIFSPTMLTFFKFLKGVFSISGYCYQEISSKITIFVNISMKTKQFRKYFRVGI